jgi:hypothetical protein
MKTKIKELISKIVTFKQFFSNLQTKNITIKNIKNTILSYFHLKKNNLILLAKAIYTKLDIEKIKIKSYQQIKFFKT